jgi:hypothetical protein
MKNLLLGLMLTTVMVGSANAMSVMTNATGPYNYTCSVFTEGNKTDRMAALAFAQGYFAALNMEQEIEKQVNLQERWQELNAFVIRFCTDKSNPYLYRRFVNDAASAALEAMK